MKFIKSILPLFLALGTIACGSSNSFVSGNENVTPEIVRLIQGCDSNDDDNCSKANSYYEKACNLNNATGCSNLGFLYSQGKGVRQEHSKANSYFEKACNLNYGGGCTNLGVSYVKGEGVRQNKTTAKWYFGKACDYGDQDGCDKYRILNEQGY